MMRAAASDYLDEIYDAAAARIIDYHLDNHYKKLMPHLNFLFP